MNSFATQPLSAIEVETIVLGALAVLFAAVWARDREPGLSWIAVAMTLAALWYFYSERLQFAGPNMDVRAVRLGGLVIGSSILLINVGVVRYLGPPHGWALAAIVALCAPGALLLAALVLQIDVPRRVFHVGLMLPYLGSAALALRRHVDERGAGHLVLALVLLSLPLTPVVMAAAGIDAKFMRHFAAVPVIVFALILLTVSLLRRRRALEREVQRRTVAEEQLRSSNAQLEERVAERTARLQDLIAGLEGFSRSVSHDLRGPLGGIAELARVAQRRLEQGDDDLAKRALPTIASQADASTRLVTTLLDLARLGDTPPVRQPVSLSSLVRSAYDEVALGMRGTAPPELQCAALPDAMADGDLLRPVLVNLIGNAAKFSREAAAPRVQVDASFEDGTLVVCVRDNGVGFDPAVAQQMFTPFRRFHGGRFEGHGLGLSLVRRAVERHGGRVWATSSPGEGASFCFEIPAARVPARPEAATEASG